MEKVFKKEEKLYRRKKPRTKWMEGLTSKKFHQPEALTSIFKKVIHLVSLNLRRRPMAIVLRTTTTTTDETFF